MKNLFLVAMVGVFSLVSVLEVEAGRGCRRARRCGGGCQSGCYTNGCQTGGCYANGGACYTGGCQVNGHGGAYVDPHAAGGPVQPGAGNAAPVQPGPAAP